MARGRRDEEGVAELAPLSSELSMGCLLSGLHTFGFPRRHATACCWVRSKQKRCTNVKGHLPPAMPTDDHIICLAFAQLRSISLQIITGGHLWKACATLLVYAPN
jgi:hypothetical protein